LNGEGIQYALISGRWASECALACLAEDDFSEHRLQSYAAVAAEESAIRHGAGGSESCS
jgi:flavin-dependent dehydrogenase